MSDQEYIDPETGLPEGVAVCDNCGKYEHTLEQLRVCLDSMIGSGFHADEAWDAYETLSGQLPEQSLLVDQRSTERQMRGICGLCGRRANRMHLMDTGDATVLPEGCCPVLFERRNPNQQRRSD